MASALPIESRRAPRDLVSFRAAIEGPDHVLGSLLMVDISPYGFMARSVLALRPGDAVSVTLPVAGVRRAIVRWALGGRLGGEFVDPIASHGYARLLATAPHDRPRWNEV